MVDFQPPPIDEPKIRRPDIRKAQTLLKWQPLVKLDEGLNKTIQYFPTLG